MSGWNLRLLLGGAAMALLAVGCSAAPGESTEETEDPFTRLSGGGILGAPRVPVPTSPTVEATKPAPTETSKPPVVCGTREGKPVQCGAGACVSNLVPEMVYLINFALTNPPVGSQPGAFILASGKVQIPSGSTAAQKALNVIRDKYNSAAGTSFEAPFWNFVNRLWASAEPQYPSGWCGAPRPYFSITFLPSEMEALGASYYFMLWSQEQYIPPHLCEPVYARANRLPQGAVCGLVDPWWGNVGSTNGVAPQIVDTATPGLNWVSTAAIVPTKCPDDLSQYDAWGNMTTQFTVYRAVGQPLKMVTGNTAAFKIQCFSEREGMVVDFGTYQATAMSAVATGSRATFQLNWKL